MEDAAGGLRGRATARGSRAADAALPTEPFADAALPTEHFEDEENAAKEQKKPARELLLRLKQCAGAVCRLLLGAKAEYVFLPQEAY